MIDPIIGPQQNCPRSETQPSREEQEHEDEHQEAHDSAWPIAPPPTVGPSWHCRNQEHDQDDEQDCAECHESHPSFADDIGHSRHALAEHGGARYRSAGAIHLGVTRGSPPGLPGGGITGVVPGSGTGGRTDISGLRSLGGRITPSVLSSRSLKVSPGRAVVVVERGSCFGSIGGDWSEPGLLGSEDCAAASCNNTATTAMMKAPMQPRMPGPQRIACFIFEPCAR